MAVLGAGDLRERVTIQQVTTARDAVGGLIETWANLGTFWAKVAPMSAGEQYRRSQLQASAAWKITVRYNADVTPQMRIVWRGHVYQIRGLLADSHRRFLELACDELMAVPTEPPGNVSTTADSTEFTADSTEITADAA